MIKPSIMIDPDMKLAVIELKSRKLAMRRAHWPHCYKKSEQMHGEVQGTETHKLKNTESCDVAIYETS